MVTEPTFVYRARLNRVVDGDTIRADLDLGMGIWAHNVSLRLLGFDAPEVVGARRADGIAARAHLQSLLPEDFIVETVKDKSDKYGRYLATIWVDGVNVNEVAARFVPTA
jgi:micrococcal nuclease